MKDSTDTRKCISLNEGGDSRKGYRLRFSIVAASVKMLGKVSRRML